MTNEEKYVQAFVNAFGVESEEVPSLVFQGIEAWDSVGHMGLISELEDAFDIMMETDDIIDLSSYQKGKEILTGNYGVEF
jgi:acyl carrier protein